ncbi:MAG TPA: DUF4340 domain-containing protein [Polyangiales bacterium]
MRTSVILGILAVALLAFIVVFERGSVTTTERDQRKGRVLDTFVRDRVTRIEIQRKGVTTVLTRTPDKENALGLSAWQVDKPFAAKADTEAVDSLAGELEWIDPKRTLRDLKAEDVARFGLDKPRYRVAFELAGSRVAFSVGSETPQGDGAYLQLAGANVAYVVGKNTVAALDHDPAEYHTKELHGGVSIYATRKLTLHDGGGERVIEKRGDTLWLTSPETSLASQPAVAAIVNALDGLKATRYVSDDHTRLTNYGLAAPRAQLTLETHSYDDKAKDKFHDATLRFAVGAACGSHAGESYVMVDAGPVMCATDAELQKLSRPADELREARALPLDDVEMHGVHVRVGSAELVLAQQGDNWNYQLLDHGRATRSGAADAGAVADWFKALRSVSALRFAPGAAGALDVGLGTPSVVVRFERAKENSSYELRLGRADVGEVAATRQDDHTVVWFPPRLSELLSTSVARFRKLRMLEEPQAELARLSLTTASGSAETVTKDSAGYHLHGPVAIDCERTTIDEIARLFSALEAVRYVADAPRAEHGLQHPQWLLTVSYASAKPPGAARTHTLKIGAAADGGRYAQLDADPAVFVVAQILVDQIKEPLVSRSALATPIEQLRALTIERAGSKLQVQHSGEGVAFDVVGTPSGEPARAEKLARTLATLRASSVEAYGKPATDQGFDRPQARIEVRSHSASGDATHVVLLGKAAGPDAVAGVYARRTDWDLTFVLPTDLVDTLLERQPPSSPKPAP